MMLHGFRKISLIKGAGWSKVDFQYLIDSYGKECK